MAQLQSSSITGSLIISSSGTDSTTNSLLVTNGAGYEYLKVTDGGTIDVRQSLIVNHTTNANRSLRFSWGSIFATDTNNELTLGSVYTDSTSTRIYISGKNSDNSPSDAISMQAGNGVAIFSGTHTNLFDPQALLHVSGSGIFTGDLDVTGSLHVLGDLTVGKISNQSELVDVGGNFNFDTVAEPTSAERTNFSSSIISSAGNVDNGTHYYHVIYKTSDGGETGAYGTPFVAATITDNTTAGQVELTGIPTSSDARVTARDIYRSEANDNQYYSKKLATISDNTTTTYTDNLADSSLDQNTRFYRKANSTAGYFYKDNNLFAQAGNAHYTSFGVGALDSVTIGQDNIAFGGSALQNTTSGRENTAIGYSSGVNNTTGYGNTYLGYVAGYFNETGVKNTAVGGFALRQVALTSANYNTAVGHGALWKLTGNNNHNTAIGHAAGQGYQGLSNIHIGSYAGYKSTEGSGGDYNINIGYSTGNDTTGDNNILIGRELEAPNSGSSNQLNIGNLIYATGLGSGTTQSTGNVGIGTTSPSQKFHVEGTSLFAGQGTWPMRMENNVASGNAEMSLWTVTDAYAATKILSLVATPINNQPVWYFQASGTGWQNMTLQRYGGQVGIRTLEPSANLTVQGGGTTTGKTFLAQDSNASALFTILDNGNVGIGTTSPSEKLEVVGSVLVEGNSDSRLYLGSNIGQKFSLGTVNDGTYDTMFIEYSALGVPKILTLRGNGNVGIGTTSPSDKLQVDGRVRIKSNNGLYIDTSGTYGASAAANFEVINDASSNPVLRILNAGNGGFRNISINTYGGNLGIGTLNPTTTLHVSGSGNFTDGLTVTGSILHDGDLTVEGNIYTEGALMLDGVDGLRFNQGSTSTSSPTPGIFYSGTSGQGWYFQVPNNGQEKFSFKLGSTAANREFRVVDPSWNPLFQVQGTGDAIIANNLTVGGTVTAQEFHTEFVSASIIYQSGSTKFGDTSDDTHSFTGSIGILSGSLTLDGPTPLLYLKDSTLDTEHRINSNNTELQIKGDQAIEMFTNNTSAIYIASDGDVGIGTDNPLAGLEVANAENSTLRLTRSSNNGNYLQLQGGSSGAIYNINTSGTQDHIFQTGGNEKMRITSAGNIGIGTTSPVSNYKLHVVGSSRTALLDNSTLVSAVKITNSGTGNGVYNGLDFVANSTNSSNINSHGMPLTIATSNTNGVQTTERMRITGDGNIGIGTTSPAEKLHVSGGELRIDAATTNQPALEIRNTTGNITAQLSNLGSPSYGILYLYNNGAAHTNSTGAKVASAGSSYFNGGNVGIGTTSPQYPLHINNGTGDQSALFESTDVTNTISIKDSNSTSINTTGIGVNADDLFLYAGTTGYNQRLRIQGSTGNVGIGTTSPSYKLQVNGTARFGDGSPYLKVTSTAVEVEGSYLLAGYQSGVSFYAYESVFRGLIKSDSSGGDALKLGDTAERMRIVDGNVGIGTTSPSAKLHISSSDTSNPLQIDTDTHSNLIFVSGSGRIGFRTNEPEALFHLKASDGQVMYLESTDGGAFPEIRLRKSSTEYGSIRYVRNGDLQIGNSDADGGISLRGDNSSDHLVVTHAGKVGIGTTAPSASLHVSGAADVFLIEGSGSTANTSIFAIDGNNGRLFEVSDDLSDSLFSVNTIAGLPVMEVFSDNRVTIGAFNQNDLVISGSKVGIGTDSPSHKLDVSGSINHAGASYIVPATTSGASGATTVLTGTTFDNATLIKASHDNVTTGDYTLELPAASSSTNRTLRIISDSSTDANHNIIIAPTSGDTLDGGASGFTINRNYEGLMVWSDGTEWYVIQSKNV